MSPGKKLLVYHILILIHRGAKLYSQRRANLKILNSAPGLNGCLVQIESPVTQDNCSASLGKPRDAEQLPS